MVPKLSWTRHGGSDIGVAIWAGGIGTLLVAFNISELGATLMTIVDKALIISKSESVFDVAPEHRYDNVNTLCAHDVCIVSNQTSNDSRERKQGKRELKK